MKTKQYEFATIKVIVKKGKGEDARADLFAAADDLGFEIVTSDSRAVSDEEIKDLESHVNLPD